MVDLPEAERPVSHIVRPCWRRREARMDEVTLEAWKVMLLWMDSSVILELNENLL